MSCAIALTFLYEVLVAESRYEVRGNVYRSRIKSLYEEMLHSIALYSYDPVKRVRQSIHKYADDLVATVGLVDISSGKCAHPLVCPGIRQYLVPNIPDFCDLNEEFIETWRKFFGTGPVLMSNVARAKRRRNLEGGNKNAAEGDGNTDSTNNKVNQGADADALNPGFVPILTAQDILAPRERPKVLDAVFEECQEDEHLTHDPKEIVWEFPLEVNQDIDIGNECIVFGLMRDSELANDWTSSCSFSDYCKRVYADVNLDLNATSVVDVGVNVGGSGGAETASSSTETQPVYENDNANVENPALNHNHVPEETNDVNTEMIALDVDLSTLPVPTNIAKSPEEMHIFGNYYLPLKHTGQVLNSNVKNEANATDENDDVATTAETSSPSPLDTTNMAPTSSSASVSIGSNSLELVNCTLGDLQVKSTFFYGPMGVPRVKCEATLLQGNTSKSPSSRYYFAPDYVKNGEVDVDVNVDMDMDMDNNLDGLGFYVGGFKVDASMPSVDVKDLLNECLTDLYASRDQLRGSCLLCKVWNIANGCAITFCEYCETRIFSNSENLYPLVRIFDLRRQLVSSLYRRFGYKIPKIVKDPSNLLEKMATDQVPPNDVNIYSLCGLGGILPKATPHDSRLMPNYYSVPTAMSNSVYNLLYSAPQLPNLLLDICREKRSQIVRLYDAYLTKIYNLYHSRPASSRHPNLVTLYNSVFKNGIMPQSNNAMGHFDVTTSYILTRLPMDSNLLRRCFYHKGIYADVPQGIGIWQTLAHELDFADRLHELESALAVAPAPAPATAVSKVSRGYLSYSPRNNHTSAISKPDADEYEYFADDQGDVHYNDNNANNGVPSVDENPNGWRILWTRHQNKVNASLENQQNTSPTLGGASATAPISPTSSAAHNHGATSIHPKLRRIMDVLKATGFLDSASPHVVESLMRESRIYIGFPTTLEMHVMQIPNAILDPLLFGHIGKAIVYSLPALIQNFVALSPIIKVGKRNPRRKKNVVAAAAGTSTTTTTTPTPTAAS